MRKAFRNRLGGEKNSTGVAIASAGKGSLGRKTPKDAVNLP
jgi:hypothetical protein